MEKDKKGRIKGCREDKMGGGGMLGKKKVDRQLDR